MHCFKKIRLFLPTLLLLTQFAFPVSAEVFYVTPDGDDNAAGTYEQPWATPIKAGVSAAAGDTVMFRAGVYKTGLYCLNSGSPEEGYITFMNYEDDIVVLDGEGVPHYNEEYDLWFEGFITNGNPGVENSASSYLRIQGLQVYKYESWFGILMLGPSSHIEIRDCRVSDSTAWGGHAVVIFAQLGSQNNMISGRITNVVLDGNEVCHNNTGGNEQMTLYGEVDTFEMTNNIIHDGTNICMDLIGRDSHLNQPFGRPVNGVVSGNICYNSGQGSWGSGIYTDGAGRPELPNSIVIENNICYGNDFCGIEIGDEHDGEISGGILVRNNIVFGNNSFGIWVGGGYDPPGEVRNVNVYNNTSYNNGVGELAFGPNRNITVINNIFSGSANAGYLLYVEGSGVDHDNTMDYNCWYSDNYMVWEGVEYPGFAQFAAATGQGAHSFLADPQFIDPAGGDFRLQVGSPVIDTGSAVNAPETDFDGITRPQGLGFDMGAFEFASVSGFGSDDLSNRNIQSMASYPSPFNSTINIVFTLSRSTPVMLDVYDIQGKLIRNIIKEQFNSGFHRARWNGLDQESKAVPSGIYFIKLKAGDYHLTKKVTLVK